MRQNITGVQKLLAIATFLFVFSGCQQDDLDTDTASLAYKKFDGTYEILSAFSKKAVDLNNDGVKSNNLIKENSSVLFSTIEIQALGESRQFADNAFFYSEFWPTENDLRLKTKGVITVYDNKVFTPYYDMFGNLVFGEFNEDLSSATFSKDIKDDDKNTLIELKSMNMKEDETISVNAVRKLYTSEGWITTEIKALYKKSDIE